MSLTCCNSLHAPLPPPAAGIVLGWPGCGAAAAVGVYVMPMLAAGTCVTCDSTPSALAASPDDWNCSGLTPVVQFGE